MGEDVGVEGWEGVFGGGLDMYNSELYHRNDCLNSVALCWPFNV